VQCCNKYVNNLPCTLRDVLRYVLNAGYKRKRMLSTIFIFFSTCILLLQQYY